MDNQQLVFPKKFEATHRVIGVKVSVFSTGVINTSDDKKGTLMVLYSDGLRILCKESEEFNKQYEYVEGL